MPGGKIFNNDILVHGMLDRNRALDGDLVVVELLPQPQWMILEQDIIEKGLIGPIILGEATGLSVFPMVKFTLTSCCSCPCKVGNAASQYAALKYLS